MTLSPCSFPDGFGSSGSLESPHHFGISLSVSAKKPAGMVAGLCCSDSGWARVCRPVPGVLVLRLHADPVLGPRCPFPVTPGSWAAVALGCRPLPLREKPTPCVLQGERPCAHCRKPPLVLDATWKEASGPLHTVRVRRCRLRVERWTRPALSLREHGPVGSQAALTGTALQPA